MNACSDARHDVPAGPGERSHPASRRPSLDPKYLFLIASICFGAPLALVSAPFQAADEPQHFLRAYQVSEGRFVPDHRGGKGGGDVPVSVRNVIDTFQHVRANERHTTSWAEIRSAWQVPLEPGRRTYRPFVNTAIYSPLAYLPQASAVLA